MPCRYVSDIPLTCTVSAKSAVKIWLARLAFVLLLLSVDPRPQQAVAGGSGASRPAADLVAGQKVFLSKCVECHGNSGQGVESAYEQPLTGDRSVSSLAKLISTTMPAGDESSCVGDDAFNVAGYIYHAFYSPLAQARIRPPRIEFARLTVDQYRYTVADLFSTAVWPTTDSKGLNAEYFTLANFKSESSVIKRVDPVVDFSLDPESEEGKLIGDEEWAIRWDGSIVAPETGEYEFILDTPHGVRLWLNDNSDPLIDGWVASGDLRPTGAKYLLAGRVYPIRVDIHKRKNEKAKALPSTMQLQWKPPGRPIELVPTRFLMPVGCSETLVIDTPFPPDDQSMGYVRGNAVSREWDQATTNAALDVVHHIAKELPSYVNATPADKDYQAKCRDYCLQLANKAFRRPLSDEEAKHHVDNHFQQAEETESAVKRSLLHILKSPLFLYLGLNDDARAYAIASKLSFVLWDSIPDAELWKSAGSGQLLKDDEFDKQVKRMVADPRARSKLKLFLFSWLKVDHIGNISKNQEMYPRFDDQLSADLRTSLELFIDDVLEHEEADFRRLLLSHELFLNKNLADFYQYDVDDMAGFQKRDVDPEKHAGIISHPYLMAGFAYRDTGSPIHRGVFLSRNVLGRRLKPPPEAFTPLPPELHPDLNTRERVLLQTKGESCSSCHEMINGLGFTLENFDAVGRFRVEEKRKPVDVTGQYETSTGETKQVAGVRELAEFLSDSPEVHAAFAEKVFHHFVNQSLLAYGLHQPDRLKHRFEASNFDIYALLEEIARIAALN